MLQVDKKLHTISSHNLYYAYYNIIKCNYVTFMCLVYFKILSNCHHPTQTSLLCHYNSIVQMMSAPVSLLLHYLMLWLLVQLVFVTY